MPRKYVLTKEDKDLRRHAANVALAAIHRLEVEGLIATSAYRFSSTGITLDRALEQDPMWMRDISGVSFPEWLETKQEAGFRSKDYTIGYWADQRSQLEVISLLRQYALEIADYIPEAA